MTGTATGTATGTVRASRRARGGAALVAAALVLLGGAAAGASGGSSWSSWQGGPLHDGYAADSSPVPPLELAWRAELPDAGAAVVTGGRAFVVGTVRDEDGGRPYGSLLHALDVRTGERLWTVPLGGTYFLGGATADDARVYSVNGDGLVRAHDPADGHVLWQHRLSQYSVSSPPVAAFGQLYVSAAGSGGTLYALDGATGDEVWSAPVANGDHSAPVVAADRVHVAYACGVAYAFDRRDGSPVWQRTTGCSGGGGKTAVLHQGRLFVRDAQYGAVLDAADGRELRPLSLSVAPAFHDGIGYSVEDGLLRAWDAATGDPRWTAGAGDLQTPPVVAAGTVYVGGQGRLYAYREADGALVWQDDTPVDAVDEQNVSQPYDGTTVADGLLLVSGGDTLSAYRTAAAGPSPSATPSATATAVPSPTRSPVVLPVCLPVAVPLVGCAPAARRAG